MIESFFQVSSSRQKHGVHYLFSSFTTSYEFGAAGVVDGLGFRAGRANVLQEILMSGLEILGKKE